ncbi:hypothetical protein EON79_12945 [bacterium]|nr:MAG: hypothetical protein EON79_12945 [bacterium]
MERVGESTDTPFLKPEAMAYYWPKILEAMLLKPTSPSSIEMIQLIFSRWKDEERLTEKFWEMHRLTPHLSTEDIWTTQDVLMEISPHLPPMDEGRNPLFAPSEIVRGALRWIDKKWPQTQGITHEEKVGL